MERIALNYMYSELEKTLGKSIKQFSKNGFVEMSMDIPKKELEKELYRPVNEYETVELKCCDSSVKVQYFDREIGIYFLLAWRD